MNRKALKARKGNVTAKEEAAYQDALAQQKKGKGLNFVYSFELDKATIKKVEGMAFRQVQTTNQLSRLTATVNELQATVAQLAANTEAQLKRIKVATAEPANPIFATRCFNRIGIRLRKRAVDVTIEDLHQGVKRKRLFRCDSFSKAEEFITSRTLIDGVVEMQVIRRTAKKSKNTKGKPATKKVKALADVRYEMERDGIPNQVIPTAKKDTAYFKEGNLKKTAELNRTREKAERVIIKLCSNGGKMEGAVNEPLINALVDNGFDPTVAFAAASNCGRITKKGLDKKYTPKKEAQATTSNEY